MGITKEHLAGIYKIVSPTNKIYIGQSWNLNKRKDYYSRSECKNQTRLHNSFIKHGWEAHNFEILLELRDDISQATLDFWEEYYMDLYKANYELMNLREAGSRGKLSEETKNKISIKGKGRKHKESTKIKMRESKLGVLNPMYCKKPSEVTRKKVAEANTGKKRNQASIEKMQIAQKNRYLLHPKRGSQLSDATKIKIGKANSLPIVQFDIQGNFIQKWESIAQAQRATKCYNIVRCLKEKTRTAGGFVWKYLKTNLNYAN